MYGYFITSERDRDGKVVLYQDKIRNLYFYRVTPSVTQ